METIIIILSFVLLLLVTTNILSVVLLFKLKKTNDSVSNIASNDKDMAEAFSNVMKFLNNNFENNFKLFQNQQEWLQNNLGKIAEIDTENSQKIYNTLYQNQVFLNRLGEFLGYRPKTNVGE